MSSTLSSAGMIWFFQSHLPPASAIAASLSPVAAKVWSPTTRRMSSSSQCRHGPNLSRGNWDGEFL